MFKSIDGKIFGNLIVSGANMLENEKETINALNVFPVPDGDTGSNMGMTIGAVRDKADAMPEAVGECAVMIADTIDYEEYLHGVRPDGVFFSGQSFITKLSTGIASIITGVVYSIVGFSDTAIEQLNVALANGASFKADYPEYAAAMFFLCSIPPAIGLFLSVIPLKNYALSNKEHSRILAELQARRHGNEAEE